MHSTDQRMKIARKRAGIYRHKRADIIFFACAALSCGLLYFMIRAFVALTAEEHTIGEVPQLYGSMLLFRSAGGYVLTGIVSFVSAVALTLICARNREKRGIGDKH